MSFNFTPEFIAAQKPLKIGTTIRSDTYVRIEVYHSLGATYILYLRKSLIESVAEDREKPNSRCIVKCFSESSYIVEENAGALTARL